MKTSLANAQACRVLTGIVVETMLGPKASPVTEEIRVDLHLYGEATRVRAGHTLGPPHPHAYGGLLRGLLKSLDEKLMTTAAPSTPPTQDSDEAIRSSLKADRAELLEQLELCERLNPMEVSQTVLRCKVQDCYKAGTVKLHVAWNGQCDRSKGWSRPVRRALAMTGWSPQAGAAPPSNLERQLQQSISSGRAGGRQAKG